MISIGAPRVVTVAAEVAPVPCVTEHGRAVHLGVPLPPWKTLCGAPMWDHWPPWYALRYPDSLPECARCTSIYKDRL